MSSAITNGSIRDGSVRIYFYNDGLTVFLYDLSNENRIRESNPKIIWFAGTEAFEDEATKKLLESDTLLVYGLHSDGGVEPEIIVGEPLSDDELPKAIWLEPESGFLNLPTGKLCIHSFNTLPMGDNDDEPGDEGAVVEVPFGQYKITIYRKNSAAMYGANMDWSEESANEIIVLTPAADFTNTSNILFRYCLE